MYESIVLNLFGKLAMANIVSEFFFSNDSPQTVCSDSSFKLHKYIQNPQFAWYIHMYVRICTYVINTLVSETVLPYQ